MSIKPTSSFTPAEAQDFRHSSSYDLCLVEHKSPQQATQQNQPPQGDDLLLASSYDLCLQVPRSTTPPSIKPTYSQGDSFLNLGDDPEQSPQKKEAQKTHVSASNTFTESFSSKFDPVGEDSPDLFC